MKTHRYPFILLLLAIGLITLFVSACSAQIVPAPPATSSGSVNVSVGQAELLAQIPGDLPIVPGAQLIEVNVTESATQVKYISENSTTQVVVNYYEQSLNALGWLPDPNNADVTVGPNTTLVRVNANGDRITVNVSTGEDGQSVLVDVKVERA